MAVTCQSVSLPVAAVSAEPLWVSGAGAEIAAPIWEARSPFSAAARSCPFHRARCLLPSTTTHSTSGAQAVAGTNLTPTIPGGTAAELTAARPEVVSGLLSLHCVCVGSCGGCSFLVARPLRLHPTPTTTLHHNHHPFRSHTGRHWNLLFPSIHPSTIVHSRRAACALPCAAEPSLALWSCSGLVPAVGWPS